MGSCYLSHHWVNVPFSRHSPKGENWDMRFFPLYKISRGNREEILRVSGFYLEMVIKCLTKKIITKIHESVPTNATGTK